jgi:hypothetical protein
MEHSSKRGTLKAALTGVSIFSFGEPTIIGKETCEKFNAEEGGNKGGDNEGGGNNGGDIKSSLPTGERFEKCSFAKKYNGNLNT